MNVFQSIDNLFPTGKDRGFGEVVGCHINFYVDNVFIDRIYEKRKAWYVDASVNAFHMHRSLVRSWTELKFQKLPRQGDRLVKRQIALAVLNSYLANAEKDTQHCEYHVNVTIGRAGKLAWTEVSNYWDLTPEWVQDTRTLVEVVDHMPMDLQTQVDIAVINCSERMASQGKNITKMDEESIKRGNAAWAEWLEQQKLNDWPLIPYSFNTERR